MDGEEEGWAELFQWIHSTVLNLAVRNQIVLPRWTKVHTIMQPKDTGLPKLHRLRPLNIYEADLNLLLRVILARRVLRKVERGKELADETWGSRKQRSAGDVGLHKTITLELSALSRTPLSQIDLDAKSCYGRITRQIAAQTCYKFGIPREFCIWFTLLLNKQRHHIITANGILKRTYGTNL